MIKNKKILYSSILGLVLFFAYAFNANAINIGWDRFIVGGLRTLYSGDKVVIGNIATTTNATLEVVGQIASGYYTATSTSATSTFSGDLRFNAELLPDGLTCSNGEILKKTGANDWDCASDSTGSAVGTVSTSTIPTIGNLAYWTSSGYPSLLGTVATSTPTMTAPLTYSGTLGSFVGGVAGTFDCTSATGSVKGCLTSTDWTTFNSKQAGDATLTALAGLTISAGSLITGTGADAFSVLAGGTNGYVLAMSGSAPVWVATTTLSTISGTLDISAQSNLTAGTNITLTNDDLSVDDAFLLNTGDIGTGVYDFGGATSLELPNNGTVNANGEITTDDTTGQLRYYAGSAERVLVPIWSRGFTYATSSAFSATTTKPYLGQAPYALTITTAFCETDTGTLNVSVRDGAGNRLDLINASTTIGTFTFSTNNTFTKGESIRAEVGTPATSPTLVSCTFIGTPTAD